MQLKRSPASEGSEQTEIHAATRCATAQLLCGLDHRARRRRSILHSATTQLERRTGCRQPAWINMVRRAQTGLAAGGKGADEGAGLLGGGAGAEREEGDDAEHFSGRIFAKDIYSRCRNPIFPELSSRPTPTCSIAGPSPSD